MATAVIIEPTLRAGAALNLVGAVPFSATVTNGTYTAASGGITIDFTTVLASIPVQTRPVHADLVRAVGTTPTGYMAVFTKTTTANQFTCKLWSGTTQFSNGAITQTIAGLLFFAPGAQS